GAFPIKGGALGVEPVYEEIAQALVAELNNTSPTGGYEYRKSDPRENMSDELCVKYEIINPGRTAEYIYNRAANVLALFQRQTLEQKLGEQKAQSWQDRSEANAKLLINAHER